MADMIPTTASEPTDVHPVHDQEPAVGPTPRRWRLAVDLGHPFAWGFTATAGGLVAIALGGSLASLSTVLVSIGAALFIAMALEPLVQWLENHRMSRGLAIGVVFAAFALILSAIVAVVAPVAVGQVALLAGAMPTFIANLQNTDWFKAISQATVHGDLYAAILA